MTYNKNQIFRRLLTEYKGNFYNIAHAYRATIYAKPMPNYLRRLSQQDFAFKEDHYIRPFITRIQDNLLGIAELMTFHHSLLKSLNQNNHLTA